MKIKFSTSYAAFEDYGRDYQLMVIFDKIRERVRRGETEGSILDINGNKIGEWSL